MLRWLIYRPVLGAYWVVRNITRPPTPDCHKFSEVIWPTTINDERSIHVRLWLMETTTIFQFLKIHWAWARDVQDWSTPENQKSSRKSEFWSFQKSSRKTENQNSDPSRNIPENQKSYLRWWGCKRAEKQKIRILVLPEIFQKNRILVLPEIFQKIRNPTWGGGGVKGQKNRKSEFWPFQKSSRKTENQNSDFLILPEIFQKNRKSEILIFWFSEKT